MLLFVEYPKCTTCRRAKKWLLDHNVAFQARDIKEESPSSDELATWQGLSGLPLRKFFNTSGMKYRELNLKEKLDAMADKEMLALLASDGMLVKRPILIGSDFILVGFKEEDWNARVAR